jgi:hypothetical protein
MENEVSQNKVTCKPCKQFSLHCGLKIDSGIVSLTSKGMMGWAGEFLLSRMMRDFSRSCVHLEKKRTVLIKNLFIFL